MLHKLEIKLKQHTPIIHFQYDQAGATLRATEVKPALDRYLSKRVDIPNGKDAEWLLPSSVGTPFNYKMNIISEQPIRTHEIDNFPCFFGNMKAEHKKFLQISEELKIIFNSYNSEIIKAIENNIAEFFLTHNFGSRKTKGFGSFTVIEHDKPKVFALDFNINVDKNHAKFNDRNFFRNTDINEDSDNELIKLTRLFAQINYFYQSLRSGLNRPGQEGITNFYCKPALFHYLKDKVGVQWDKKTIKELFFADELKAQMSNHQYSDILEYSTEDKYLYKELFGLSSNEAWRNPYNISIAKSNPDFKRFTSPILFKIIKVNDDNYKVYLILNKIAEDYFNKPFLVEAGGQSKTLYTPSSFSLNDFFFYLKNECPPIIQRCHSDNNINYQTEFQILKSIYSQFQK